MKLLPDEMLQSEPGRFPLEPSEGLQHLLKMLAYEALVEKHPEGFHLPTLLQEEHLRFDRKAFVLSAPSVPNVYDASGRPAIDHQGFLQIHLVEQEPEQHETTASGIIKPGPQVVN